MALKSLIFDNFSGGEWGTRGGENAPANTFHGKNVIVYSTGMLGPRAGLKNITPSGMPDGKLIALAQTPTPGRDGVFIIGETAYRFNLFDPTGDTPVTIGTVENGSGEVAYLELDTVTNLTTTVPEGPYRIDQINDVVTHLSEIVGGHALEIYGAQLVLAENTSSPRVFASAIGDFTDFSSGFFLDVGDNWQVTALLNQRNYLTILKRTGIYVIGGQLTNDSNTLTVRRISGADGVLHPWHVAMDSQDTAWLLQTFGMSPASFTGSNIVVYGHLKFAQREDDGTAALPPVKRAVINMQGQLTPDTQAFIQGGDSNEMFLRHNGVWSYHKFETSISGMARGVDENLVITDGGDDDDPAQIYATRFNIDRPAFTSDGLFGPGDNSNTPVDAEFELPYYFNRNNNVRVRSITVEILKWNTGVATNTLDCMVTTLNRPKGAGDVENELSTWSEAGSVSSTDAQHDRIMWEKHTRWGQGFKLKFSNMVGVAIKSVQVEFEEDPNGPRKNDG